MAQAIDLNLTYHAGQDAVFTHPARRKVLSKGRRWGFTRGASQFVVERMLEEPIRVLWGDTISANITSYVERYFLPVLNQLPSHLWQWKKQEKKLIIGNSVCDFRSADQPENWEGFGYHLVILNEAGIILKNQYLWHNAVRPMLMDYPDSVAIIGGTPKGKNLFHELFQKDGKDGWKSFTFSTYTNPFLKRSEIEEMERELPETVVRQEIYAEFMGEGENVLIGYELICQCIDREPFDDARFGSEVWGLDVARHGADFSVLAKRHYKTIYELKPYALPDTMQLASQVNTEYRQAQIKPAHIFVETTGIGWGVYDRLRELGVPVMPADVGAKSVDAGLLNKRVEMYVRLHRAMKEGAKLLDSKPLKKQLANVYVEYNDRAVMKLWPKEKIKQEIGESPDFADAVALTFFEEVPLAHDTYEVAGTGGHTLHDYDPFARLDA